jgi:polyhydroxyalkanoate synthase
MAEDLFSSIAEAARVELYKTLLRVDNGARLLLKGSLHDYVPQPSDVLVDERHLLLRRYRRPQGVAQRYALPLLIIPPLMVKPDIYDLRPGRSFVEFMLRQGFDVWLVDFGRPDERDRDFRLEDYLLHPINTSVEKIREVTGSRQVSIFGYCFGGVFATIYTALERTEAVRNVVMIGAPFDYEKLGVYHTIANLAVGPLVSLTELIGYFPAMLSQTFFQISTPRKLAERPFNLVWNLWNDEWLESYEAMNKWMTDFLHYPEAAFKQFAQDIVVGNKLLTNELEMFGRRVDLSKITASYLVLASPDDHFGPPAAARPIIDAIGSTDKTFMLVRGGHAGAVAGSKAPATWKLVAEWLATRSDAAAGTTTEVAC